MNFYINPDIDPSDNAASNGPIGQLLNACMQMAIRNFEHTGDPEALKVAAKYAALADKYGA